MAATIRLTRHGAKKRPFYRIVVTDKRAAGDRKRLELLGTYDPRANPPDVKFNTEKLALWLKRGAQPSLTVSQLIKRSGIVLDAPATEPAASS